MRSGGRDREGERVREGEREREREREREGEREKLTGETPSHWEILFNVFILTY